MLLRRQADCLPSFPEIVCEECSNPPACIFGCLSIVLRPMAEHHSPSLEDFNVKGVVSASIGDELNGCSRIPPVRDRPRAVLGRRPVVELTDENESRYVWTGAYHATPWIEGDGRAKAEIAGVDEALA